MTAAVAEVGGSHHILLFLPRICLMWKVARNLMMELEADHHILFTLPGVQEVKKEKRTAMEEV
eukprot:1148657-Ditylum_brightwellii.AAC.1